MRTSTSNADSGWKISLAICSPSNNQSWRDEVRLSSAKTQQSSEVVSKRFCKKQQMQWSKEGAHLLLQTRVRTLNGELSAIFKRWYPDMDLEVEEMPVAA